MSRVAPMPARSRNVHPVQPRWKANPGISGSEIEEGFSEYEAAWRDPGHSASSPTMRLFLNPNIPRGGFSGCLPQLVAEDAVG
jgi:hypothetical protein